MPNLRRFGILGHYRVPGSGALTVVPGRVEYYGYDDGGTPEDESDDGYFYYMLWYRLTSGRDASDGEMWFYDPDFLRVQSWSVSGLPCIEHNANDGLRASPEGLLHGVVLRVPVSVMEKAGTYRFVLHFYDNYTDGYRNHQVKAALEKNALLSPDELHIWIDTYNRAISRRSLTGRTCNGLLQKLLDCQPLCILTLRIDQLENIGLG